VHQFDVYEFFLNALKARLLRVINELENTEVGSPQYAALVQEQIKIQAALSSLDDIANLV
jgi:hypothetical protein